LGDHRLEIVAGFQGVDVREGFEDTIDFVGLSGGR
jgi:hypothetical protein